MYRYQFFVRYCLPYLLGLMLGGLALKAVQDAGGGDMLAKIAWGSVTVGFIVAWVLVKRALKGRAKVKAGSVY